MIITFCGHSSVSDDDEVRQWLRTVLERFLLENEVIFCLGGDGAFDRLVASVVREKKKINPKIQSVLVIPYLNRSFDDADFDYTIFPPLETVPPRYAISKRNTWMVDQADIVIAYVTHDWGGAAKMLNNAQVKKKPILLYPQY